MIPPIYPSIVILGWIIFEYFWYWLTWSLFLNGGFVPYGLFSRSNHPSTQASTKPPKSSRVSTIRWCSSVWRDVERRRAAWVCWSLCLRMSSPTTRLGGLRTTPFRTPKNGAGVDPILLRDVANIEPFFFFLDCLWGFTHGGAGFSNNPQYLKWRGKSERMVFGRKLGCLILKTAGQVGEVFWFL